MTCYVQSKVFPVYIECITESIWEAIDYNSTPKEIRIPIALLKKTKPNQNITIFK